MRPPILIVLCLTLATGLAQAEMLELDSCVDASGNTIQSEMDGSLSVLVRSGMEDGRRVIRYNPDLLPELSAGAKQFFFAHACARLAMGDRSGGEATLAQARRADCLGLATLRDSGLLRGPDAVQKLQAELVFSPEAWAQLPGPQRSFDLLACQARGGIRLPLATPPSEAQVGRNACVRSCGDQLLRCQRRSDAGEGCQGAYDRCEAVCKGR